LVELLMMALKTDLETGKLPAKTMKEAKLYISAIEQPSGELVPVSSF
jgi:hypothetical protein